MAVVWALTLCPDPGRWECGTLKVECPSSPTSRCAAMFIKAQDPGRASWSRCGEGGRGRAVSRSQAVPSLAPPRTGETPYELNLMGLFSSAYFSGLTRSKSPTLLEISYITTKYYYLRFNIIIKNKPLEFVSDQMAL